MRYPESSRRLDTEVCDSRHLSRRTALAGVATGLVGGLAGCLDDPSFPEADVIAAPDDQLVFDSEELPVTVGETYEHTFEVAG